MCVVSDLDLRRGGLVGEDGAFVARYENTCVSLFGKIGHD